MGLESGIGNGASILNITFFNHDDKKSEQSYPYMYIYAVTTKEQHKFVNCGEPKQNRIAKHFFNCGRWLSHFYPSYQSISTQLYGGTFDGPQHGKFVSTILHLMNKNTKPAQEFSLFPALTIIEICGSAIG